MTKIKITQVKSGIDRPERQKKTLRALGLNKMNASREVEATAQILGMVRTVNHLLKIEESADGSTEPAAVPQKADVTAIHPEVLQAKAPAAEAPATGE
jgi:large subunit ribosomal protein L30